MGISLFFFFLFMRLFAEINGGSRNDECKASRCSHHGPVIRFPFRLKHQPEHCGYPEFELSCSEEKRTILELPYSGKLWVKEINYTSQRLFSGQDDYTYRNFSFFNCSESKIRSYAALAPSLTVFSQGNYFMNWLKPMCGNCEAKGNKCQRKKNNSRNLKSNALINQQKLISLLSFTGAPIDKMVLTEAILGFLHFTFGIFIIFIVYRSNKLKREHRINIQKFLEDYRALKPSRYSYADIKKITNNFKDKLGQGGYGTVYKGKLSNEVFVAVKILDDFKGNGEEFINEVGTMSWHKLQDIAIGIAKGIEYLHQGCDQRILHLDIKPHNILLDHNSNPKISDFGLAKLCSKEQSAVSMTAVRGTMGYIALEMLSRNFGNVSYKSDVYSFGMLLIEMVGGRKNIDATVENTSQAYFPEWL
ncbi:Rust resistance kinase Lr10 [Vitis vinifera]|uniref:non-specific serine/threonine protein kinase n=1 Tax=Vitis vinifera TaxID=29760 RepID=A0A438HSX2_VITVI|nr:Rust resistance kinase Lr10 [Vitis vinifera]